MLAIRAIDHFNLQRSDEAERDARRAIELMAEPGIPFSPLPWTSWCLILEVSGRADEIAGSESFVAAARATDNDYMLANALTVVATQWYVLADVERCLPSAEEATMLAQRTGNPTLIASSATFLGAVLETVDPPRARAALEMAVELGTTVSFGTHIAAALAYLARMGTGATGPTWATRFRSVLDIAYEAGDTRMVLAYLDTYTQALATTDRVEAAAMLRAAVGELAPHMSNPISVAHPHETNQRLLTQLGEERFAELTADGANLGYEETVALARAELDRVIATDES